MNIGTILFFSIILFAIIYFSVKLAIGQLFGKQDELIVDNLDNRLVKLRDIGILNHTELEEVIALYHTKSIKEKEYKMYKKYETILNELKKMGYFTEEQYSIKVLNLKKYFKID